MTKRVILSFFVMLLLSSVYGEGEINRFVDFEKNAAELKFIENPDFWAKEVESTNTWWRPVFTHNKQRFLCTSRGTLLIRKLDCIGQRNINGLESYKERKR